MLMSALAVEAVASSYLQRFRPSRLTKDMPALAAGVDGDADSCVDIDILAHLMQTHRAQVLRSLAYSGSDSDKGEVLIMTTEPPCPLPVSFPSGPSPPLSHSSASELCAAYTHFLSLYSC